MIHSAKKAIVRIAILTAFYPAASAFAQTADTTGTSPFVLSGGETLYSLSTQFNIPIDSILTLNENLPAYLQAGDVLRVPTDRLARRIRVAPGETLFAIARQYGVSVDEIKRANSMSGSNLRSGQTLLIPGHGDTDLSDSVKHSRQVVASMENIGSGIAVVYPQNYIGRTTASGRAYRPDLFVVSHPDLRTGSIVLLYSPDSEKETFAEIIDRAFTGHPQIIDVSEAVATHLGMKRDGTDLIEMKAVEIITEN